MPEYRLSDRAISQLDEIFDSSIERFGRYQTEAYWAGLTRTFDLLAEFPRMGRAADDVIAGLRRFRFQSHHIFYTIAQEHITIRSVLHVRQSVRPDLIE